jgi:hypothetical protein
MRASIVAQAAQQIIENKGVAGTDGRGIATNYAELCTQANGRLTRCASLARDGRLVESVHLADESPALLDLCTTLDFPKVEDWRTLCKTNGWPLAPAIDAKAIQVINDAYGAGLPLEPLLNEYRAVMRNRDRHAAVPILRRLVQAEPHNQTWKEDLIAFETRRLEEVAAETAQAETTGDIVKLTDLAAEIASASWSVTVGKELIATVEQTLRRTEIGQAKDECQTLSNRLTKAFTERDVARTEDTLGQLQTVTIAHGISLSDEVAKQVAAARSWVNNTRTAEATEKAYKEAEERLAKAVEEGNGASAITALDNIARFNRRPPEVLAKRANDIAEEYRTATRRTRGLKLAAAIVTTITAIATGFLVYRTMALQKRAKTTDQELSNLYSKQDLNGLTNRLATIKTIEPNLWKTAEVQSWIPKAAILGKQWQDQRAEIESHLQTVECWITQGFPDEERTVTLTLARIGEALQRPSTRTTDHARSTNANQKWQEELARRQMTTAENWTRTHDSATEAVKHASYIIGKGTPSATVEEHLKKASEAVKMATRFAVTPETQQEVGTLAQLLDQATQALSRRDSLLTTLKSPQTLKTYLDAGTEFTANYPNHPLTPRIASISRNRTMYEMLAEGPTTGNPHNRFWGDGLNAGTTPDSTLGDRWQTTKQELLQWGDEALLVDVQQWTEITGRARRLLILRGKPQKDGEDYVLTCFDVNKDARTVAPDFKTERFRNAQGDRPQRLAYCSTVEELVALVRLTTPEGAFQFMAQAVQRIAASTEIPAILKARLLEGLLQQAATLFGQRTPLIWTTTLKRLQTLDHDVHWLCTAHYAYAGCAQAAADTVAVLNQDPGIHLAARMVRDRATIRGIQFVGVVPPDAATNTIPQAAKTHCELWTLRSTSDTAQRICIAAERSRDGQFRLMPQMTLLPAEPVFAPMEDTPTSECATRIANVCKVKTADVLRQMTSSPMWPLNAHQ